MDEWDFLPQKKTFFWIFTFDRAISSFTKEMRDHQGAWRDANTGEVLDLSQFWAWPGWAWIDFHLYLYLFKSSALSSSPPQPNGVRVQNCAGIFENVNI